MSKTVDERVVSMQFDNAQFERNVSTSMSTLDKLKRSLNLDDAAKGLDNVSKSASKFNLSGIGEGVEAVKAKFSALEVMAVTALANITNSAVNAGKRLVSSFTIEPIKSGFEEYETQINAVQTILSNTRSKGTNLDDVNKALDELNTYADKTIYNFTEMTRNIGTFTAAGVDLDTSVSAIKGIANLAAVSGSNSQQASTAMYQLSQALASGTVKLQDWNSVVNAGMGGQVFQDALKETARVHGIAIDDMITKEGSFRETLSEGWLSSEILTETLSKFTGDLTEAQLESMGYTKEQAAEILALGEDANNAATKVKTFTQLMDTLKEAAQSGWTQSWETIIGDFEEAKSLWTDVSDYFSEAIGKSAEARNQMLKGWADGGGREMGINAIKNAFNGLLSLLKPIREAFKDIFPPMTSERLLSITSSIEKFTSKLKLSDDRAAKIKDTFKGLFSVVSIFGKVLGAVGKGVLNLLGSKGVGDVADKFLDLTSSVGKFLTQMNEGFDKNGLSGTISKVTSGISDLLSSLVSKLPSAGKGFINILDTIWESVKKVFSFLSDNVSIGDIFSGLVGGGIFVVAKKFADMIDTIKESIEGLFSKEKGSSKFSEILDSLHDSLESFSTGIKIASLVSIAIAVGILSSSLRSISGIEAGDVTKSLGAIGSMMVMLNLSLKSIVKTLKDYDSKGLFKATASLVLLSTSILILSSALKKISELSLGEIAKGLFAIAIMLIELVSALKYIDGIDIKMSTCITLLALAESCKILSDALAKFGALSWDEIRKGLVAMGVALAEFVGVLVVLEKAGGTKSLVSSVALLIAVQALDEIAEALEKFGSMAWDEIGRGLVAMGFALGEVVVACGALGMITGFSSLFGAGAIFIVIQGLDDLAEAMAKFGSMAWNEIGRGLVAMGFALGEVAIISGSLGWVGGLAGLVGAGSLLLAIQGLNDLATALEKFGSMSWDEIGRGLTAMGAAMGEVALGGLVNTFSGVGAAAIAEVAEPLGKLADSVKKWIDVTVPVGLGDQLASLAAGVLAFSFDGLGASAIAELAEPIGTLATSIKKWADVTVPDDLGTKLTTLANGVKTFTFGGFGASAIADVAEPLGKLADSVKKWNGIKIPENLNKNLESLADGVKSFSFAFLGAWSIDTISGPLGDLAGAVKKWNGIKISDEISGKLESFGKAVAGFAVKISDISYINSEGITSFSTAITKLNKSVQSISSVDSGKISSFTSSIEKLGRLKIDTSSLSSSASSVSKAVSQMMKAVNTTINNSKSSISSSMSKVMSGAATAVKESSSKIKSSVTEMVSSLSKTISSKKSSVTNAFKTLVSGASSAIKTNRSSFKSAGKYLGDGLISGIKSKETEVYNAGYRLGQKAVQGEKDGQQSQSPSKLTIQAGKWLGEGLVIGIDSMGRKVYNAGNEMGSNAAKSMSNAISKVRDSIESGMDSQPTIRPVLDLSDIKSGASNISDMLSMGKVIDVNGNITAINSMMSRRNQNGDNSDVISAINDLGRKIGKASGDTYTINGVTYDDGSAVSNAVQTIVRAARIERRI